MTILPDRVNRASEAFAANRAAMEAQLARHDAELAIVNGGSLLMQAIAQDTPCVAAPIADDQPPRIAETARHGYVRAAALEPGALAEAALDLLHDDAARDALRGHLVELDLRNGLDVAVEGLAQLLPRESFAG